jgi:DNA-binding MarR family transcriptional regulator
MSERLTHISKFNDTEREILQELIPEDKEEEKPELSVGEVAEKVGTDRTEISRRLREMAEENILRKKEDEDDARKSVYVITESYSQDLHKLNHQERDLRFIEKTEIEKIQCAVGLPNPNSDPTPSVNLYGVKAKDKDFDSTITELKEEIRTIRSKIRENHEAEMKEEFRKSLEVLIDTHTESDELQNDLEEMIDDLTEAMWDIENLRRKYHEIERKDLSEKQTAESDESSELKIISENIRPEDYLEGHSRKLKWRVKKLESPSEFVKEARELCREAKSMRLTIN